MGKVIRKLAEGTVPAKTIFDKRVVVECCETFHLHWRNLRLELTHETWQEFVAMMLEAERTWREGGAPASHPHFELARRLIDTRDVLNGTSAGAELCENLYKTAPPPFGLHADFYADEEFVHFHYRDLRVEMSVEDFLAFSKVMADARERLLESVAPSLARLFGRLDEANVIYAVARNWDNLPDGVEVGPHSDLDLLAHPLHLATIEELWAATPTNPATNPAQRRVPVVGQDGVDSFVLVDLRVAGDGYYPEAFVHRALATRVRHERGFWTLAPREHLLALAYHVVHHKGVLTPDYREKLIALAETQDTPLTSDGTEFAQLVAMLDAQSLQFVQPSDAGVLPKLPFLHPASTVLTSRFLVDCGGVPIHSRVYRVETESGPAIVKQATTDLAAREAAVLEQLSGPHFPRVLDASRHGAYSTCTLEAVDGAPLTDATWRQIAATDAGVHTFVSSCIEILAGLAAAGIVHRDIRSENVLVRDGRPVLIDFGWATHPDYPFPPSVEADLAEGLGREGRPPERDYCDTYAMGVMLRPLADLVPPLRSLVEAMTAAARERVADPRRLAALIPAEAELGAAAAQSVLVFAGELVDDPGLLVAAAALLDVAGKTLAIYAPDASPDDALASLGPIVDAAGLGDASLEIVVLAVERDDAAEQTLAERVDAVLTRRDVAAPFDALPRIEPTADEPRYALAACTIVRNEAPYIREWIEFHRLVGVEHFYVYDNLSEDGTADVLEPYVREGLVTLVPWPIERRGQCPAYTHCATTFGGETRWIAFMDADEFFYSPQTPDLREALREFEPYGGVHVNYVNYGTSGRDVQPGGPVIESYLLRAGHSTAPPLAAGLRAPGLDPADPDSYHPINARVSSVVQPARVVECASPHYWIYKPGWHAVTENHERHDGPITDRVSVAKLRMNHYWSKSVEECRAKFERGRADTPQGTEGRAWPGDFELRNAYLNDELDEEILVHLPALREALGLPAPRPAAELRAECEHLWAAAAEAAREAA